MCLRICVHLYCAASCVINDDDDDDKVSEQQNVLPGS